MKLKALVMTLAIAAVFSVSVAVAAPTKHPKPNAGTAQQGSKSGKGSKPCRGKMLSISGSYVSGSADDSGVGSFAIQVKRGNRAARRLGLVGTQATINVDAKTRYRRHGKAKLGDLQANDRLLVVARACKAPEQQAGSQSSGSGDEPSDPNGSPGAKNGKRKKGPDASAPAAPPTIVARLVVAHAPKQSGDDGGSTGTTDTGTTDTGTTQTDTTGTTETSPVSTDGSGS